MDAWLARYVAAWENKDADAAARLFTEDARYYETPFAQPFRGRAGIRDYWARVTADQRDIRVSAEPLGIAGNLHVAHWHAAFNLISSGAAVELDGVFLLELAAPDQCAVLREWWHAR